MNFYIFYSKKHWVSEELANVIEKLNCQRGGKEINRNLIVLHLVRINCVENTAKKVYEAKIFNPYEQSRQN